MDSGPSQAIAGQEGLLPGLKLFGFCWLVCSRGLLLMADHWKRPAATEGAGLKLGRCRCSEGVPISWLAAERRRSTAQARPSTLPGRACSGWLYSGTPLSKRSWFTSWGFGSHPGDTSLDRDDRIAAHQRRQLHHQFSNVVSAATEGIAASLGELRAGPIEGQGDRVAGCLDRLHEDVKEGRMLVLPLPCGSGHREDWLLPGGLHRAQLADFMKSFFWGLMLPRSSLIR